MFFEANVGPVHAIRHFALNTLKQRIVPTVCRGEMIDAVSMSEPGAGTTLIAGQVPGRFSRQLRYLQQSICFSFHSGLLADSADRYHHCACSKERAEPQSKSHARSPWLAMSRPSRSWSSLTRIGRTIETM